MLRQRSNHGKTLVLMLACLCSNVDTLHALPSEGKFLFEFGSTGTENGQFIQPRGIAVNECHEILVADTDNDRVQVFDQCGNFLFAFGESGMRPGQFQAPQSVVTTEDNRIAISESGEIITAEFRNPSPVQVFDKCGDFLFDFFVDTGLL